MSRFKTFELKMIQMCQNFHQRWMSSKNKKMSQFTTFELNEFQMCQNFHQRWMSSNHKKGVAF